MPQGGKKTGQMPRSKTRIAAFNSNAALHNTIGKRLLSGPVYSSGSETQLTVKVTALQ